MNPFCAGQSDLFDVKRSERSGRSKIVPSWQYNNLLQNSSGCSILRKSRMKVFSKSGFSSSPNTRENVSRTSIWIRPVDPNWRKWNGQSLEPCFKLSTISNDRSLLSHQPWKLFSQQFLFWILLFPKTFWKIINQMEKKSSQAKKSGASSCLRLTWKSKKIGENRLHMLLR